MESGGTDPRDRVRCGLGAQGRRRRDPRSLPRADPTGTDRVRNRAKTLARSAPARKIRASASAGGWHDEGVGVQRESPSWERRERMRDGVDRAAPSQMTTSFLARRLASVSGETTRELPRSRACRRSHQESDPRLERVAWSPMHRRRLRCVSLDVALPRLRGTRLVGGAPRRPGSAASLGSDSS